MALKILGAGFGRTGTESMKRAIEMLDLGPCYHMYEVLPDPARISMWRDIALGRRVPDWESIFRGYEACVDWPAVLYWRELAAYYPDAKILLTHRGADSWYASMDKTILHMLRADPESGRTLSVQTQFGGDLSRANLIETYKRHVAEVQAEFGPARLLTYELGSGWEPLCTFLECPVPDRPYPTGNTASAFHKTNAAYAR